jgi:hypothetical protein
VLENDLERLGHEVWYDQQLSGGQAWWDEILAQIRACDIFVFVLDPASVSSTACKREYTYADTTGAPILPILQSEEVNTNLLPPELQKVQFVDYVNRDPDAALRLARAIHMLPSRGPLPDPPPDPPAVPVSYIGEIAARVRADAELTLNDQKSLLFDLRKALKDEGESENARTLLLEFRRRSDLLAVVAGDIDDLISASTSSKPQPHSKPRVTDAPARQQRAEPVPSRPEPNHTKTEPAGMKHDTKPPPIIPALIRRAGFGFGVGTAVGMGAMTTYPSETVLWGLLTGLGAAFYRAISVRCALAHWLAIVGGIAGFGIAYSVFFGGGSDAIAGATVFGLSAGLAGGALVGWISSKMMSLKAKRRS